MHEAKTIGLDEARRAIDAVLTAACAVGGSPVVVAVVDRDGDPIAFARMDDADHLPRSMATRKAYTSARMRTDSGALGASMGRAGIDLKDLDPTITGFPGGVCLRMDGVVVGAIGVSGRLPDQDEELARVGAAALGL